MSVVWRRCSFSFVIVIPNPQLLKLCGSARGVCVCVCVYVCMYVCVCVEGYGSLDGGCVGCAQLGLLP